MQTMYDLVWMQAERTPEALALADDRSQRRLTYRQLIAEVEAIAAGFATRGVGPGTRIATCLPNLFEHGLAVLALQRLAAVPALINPRLGAEDIARLIEAGAMAGAIIHRGAALARAVGEVLPKGALFLAVGGAADGPEDFANCRGDPARLPPVPAPDPQAPCIIFHTSGTTGLPKGVVLAHRTSEARVVWLSTQAGLRHGPHNRALGFMPLAHVIGFYGVFLASLAYGGSYHTMSAFDPAAAVDLIEERGITYVFAAPTLYHAMLDAGNYAPRRMDSLTLCLYGGAAIEPKLLNRMAAEWDNARFRHIYGTTETMCSGYNPDPVGDCAALRAGYASRVRAIVPGGGPDDRIGPGEQGELIVDATGDAVFSRYLGRPEETAEKLRGGWYHTGDLVSLDERGAFTLRGRIDDMIRSGGESIHPEAVETILRQHECVADCAVIGLDDAKWGEIVVACISAKASISPADLDGHCRSGLLAGFMRPRAYLFVEEIARNPGNGNILRRHLRDRAAAARDSGEGYFRV
jgi:acyl-CoA synthetase (AMP-forming)/AMP-acid ligase II